MHAQGLHVHSTQCWSEQLSPSHTLKQDSSLSHRSKYDCVRRPLKTTSTCVARTNSCMTLMAAKFWITKLQHLWIDAADVGLLFEILSAEPKKTFKVHPLLRDMLFQPSQPWAVDCRTAPVQVGCLSLPLLIQSSTVGYHLRQLHSTLIPWPLELPCPAAVDPPLATFSCPPFSAANTSSWLMHASKPCF